VVEPWRHGGSACRRRQRAGVNRAGAKLALARSYPSAGGRLGVQAIGGDGALRRLGCSLGSLLYSSTEAEERGKVEVGDDSWPPPASGRRENDGGAASASGRWPRGRQLGRPARPAALAGQGVARARGKSRPGLAAGSGWAGRSRPLRLPRLNCPIPLFSSFLGLFYFLFSHFYLQPLLLCVYTCVPTSVHP
jgi:hypothetical protein